jgi:hypothetical protein
MNNNKQISVEWLMEQLSENGKLMCNELKGKTKVFTLPNEEIGEQDKVINEEEMNLIFEMAIQKFEEIKSEPISLNDMIYLYGVLAILDTIKKGTYGGNNEQTK